MAFIVLAPIVNVAVGVLGGAVNFFVCVALFETENMGKILAISATFVYTTQYFAQILANNKVLVLVLIITGMLTIAAVASRSWEWILVECLPGSDTSLNSPRIYHG